MTELRIRVKDHIKKMLDENKDKFGASINFQVNFAIHKYLIIDTNNHFKNVLDSHKKPHVTSVNPMLKYKNAVEALK